MPQRLVAYVRIARVDHWFKNLFMVLGVLLALFHEPALATLDAALPLLLAVLATCLVASSNYVINEVLDAPTDRLHPIKKHRPVPSGEVAIPVAIGEWLGLAAVGLGLAFWINAPFGYAATSLWVMGLLYNLPPIRTKEVPYLDVVSESVNNPIRLLLGWHALVPDRVPSISLLISYWMIGAFFMAAKRLAEYRFIADPEVAAGYRRSFRHYTEDRLLVSMMFYITTCALFGGIFIVRYKLELILFAPFVAGFVAYYMKLGLEPDSPVQNPERLWQKKGFFAYGIVCVALFVFLMFVRIEPLYDVFQVEPAGSAPLWTWSR